LEHAGAADHGAINQFAQMLIVERTTIGFAVA